MRTNANRVLRGLALVLCLVFVAIPFYVLIFTPKPSAAFPMLEWFEPAIWFGPMFLDALLGAWALIDLRREQTLGRRRVLKSILITIGMIWAIALVAWMKPDYADALRLVVTFLSYSVAALIVWAFVVDPQTKPNNSERSEQRAK
jgi:hypothetical protein